MKTDTLSNETSAPVGEDTKISDDDIRDTNNTEVSNEHENNHAIYTKGTLMNKEMELEHMQCTSNNVFRRK